MDLKVPSLVDLMSDLELPLIDKIRSYLDLKGPLYRHTLIDLQHKACLEACYNFYNRFRHRSPHALANIPMTNIRNNQHLLDGVGDSTERLPLWLLNGLLLLICLGCMLPI